MVTKLIDANFCPNCNANFIGEDIFKHFFNKYQNEAQALHAAKLYGWSQANPKHFEINKIRIKGVEPEQVSCQICDYTETVYGEEIK